MKTVRDTASLKMERSQKSSLARRNIHKFLKNRIAVAGLIIVVLMTLLAIFAPLLVRYPDYKFIDVSKRLLPPSSEHWLGTDRLGRDLLDRLLYGGRVSIFIGLATAAISFVIGTALGCITGYYRGIVDKFFIFSGELVSCLPPLMLNILLLMFLPRGVSAILLLTTIGAILGGQRGIRAMVLAVKEEPYVESCRANGMSGGRIMFMHLLPNIFGPIIVGLPIAVAAGILGEAALSFLGFGVPIDTPTWGNIINAALSIDIIQTHPQMWLAPGICISVFVLAINFVGDGLRDVFDPTRQG